MKNIIQFCIVSISTIYLGSCSILSTATEEKISNTNNVPIENNSNTKNIENIPVTIYSSDNLCQSYVTETVEIPDENSLEKTISLILDRNSGSDLNITGYRLNVDETKQIATIDFKLSLDSPRQLMSLSPCEQFALFGSLRQTLTKNPQWNIKQIRFLEKGQDIFEEETQP